MESALRASWCRASSATPDAWSDDNPALGQCAVSALLVQDVLGGELLRTTVKGESHYFNRLPGGQWLDVTIEQFGDYADNAYGRVRCYDGQPEERERDYVLSFPDTVARYRALRANVTLQLLREDDV